MLLGIVLLFCWPLLLLLFVCFLIAFPFQKILSPLTMWVGGEGRQKTSKGSVCSSGAFLPLEIQSVTGLHQAGQAADQQLPGSSVSTSYLV